MKREELTVDLPSGITVPRHPSGRLRDSCPDAGMHDEIPKDMNLNGYSPTLVQVKCDTCGLWTRWIPREKK